MASKRKITGTKPLFGQSRSKAFKHNQTSIQTESPEQAHFCTGA